MAADFAATLPIGRELTRAVGTQPVVDVDVREEEMRPGDILMLTSDGVHGPVQVAELTGILAELGNLTEGVERILARANTKGGRDNSTAILVRWIEA
jgi:protein phosphatase